MQSKQTNTGTDHHKSSALPERANIIASLTPFGNHRLEFPHPNLELPPKRDILDVRVSMQGGL
jgi:hypothetical protein